MPGIAGKRQTDSDTLVGQLLLLGHVLIGENPIVHIVTQGIHIEIVPVADFHPDSQGFGWPDCRESGVHEIPKRA